MNEVCVHTDEQGPDQVSPGLYIIQAHDPKRIVRVFQVSRNEEGLTLRWLKDDGTTDHATWAVTGVAFQPVFTRVSLPGER